MHTLSHTLRNLGLSAPHIPLINLRTEPRLFSAESENTGVGVPGCRRRGVYQEVYPGCVYGGIYQGVHYPPWYTRVYTTHHGIPGCTSGCAIPTGVPQGVLYPRVYHAGCIPRVYHAGCMPRVYLRVCNGVPPGVQGCTSGL